MIMFVSVERIEVKGPAEPIADENALKEWLWQNRKDELLAATTITQKVETEESAHQADMLLQESKRRLRLLDTISKVQRQYLQSEKPKIVFGCLLEGLLSLTESAYGFIGEVKVDDDGTMYLQSHAITNIAWDTATHAFYEQNVDSGLKFYNMNTLFGTVMTTKQPVISNTPKTDARAGGVPKGHPPLNHFLGIPFFSREGGKMCGMVGIANKPGGYIEEDIQFLEPFTVTCSNLIQAYRQIEQNENLINTLEQKVRERTQELELANHNLEEANRRVVQASEAQLQHFACMSHEIRTPLNCIIGLTSVLQESRLDQMQQESLRMIGQSGDLLLTVVNDVLDYSKLESGYVDVDIRRNSLQDTLDSLVHSIEMQAQPKHVEVHTLFDPLLPPRITTDARRLQQVLYNLLGNACKFSRQGGVVEFHVSLHQATEEQLHTFVEAKFDRLRDVEAVEEPDDPPVVFPPWKQILRFVVKDYGKGISRTDFSKIFQPFLQANMETERVYGGTGLGLAITLRLVRLLGGTIEVDSEEGKWSKFTVDLPFIDGIADVQRISEPLSGDYVFLIGAQDYKVRHLRRVFETFKIKHVVLDEHKVVDISTEEPMDCKRSIFLVQEDIVDQIQLPLSSSRSKLFTFGAKYRIKEGAGHYRSLTQMIPSNLLVSLCKEQETTRDYPETTSDDLEMKTDRPLRILIAEDNVVNQKVLLRMLHRMNLDDVHVVDDGKKAVDREAAEPFDVVLMDMQMPVMDGIEACSRIVQRVGAHKNAKIVFITAHVSPSFEDQCARVGAISFVPKPFKIDDIERCVQKIRTIIQAEEGGHRYLNSKEKHV